MKLYKFPRTPHLMGSNKQKGDEDIDYVDFEKIKSSNLVITEKMDGSNCAISFDDQGKLYLQSRGHYLTGGPRERHFSLFKTWASTFQTDLLNVLTDRYIMYGEWLYAKHSIFYDNLPHYFLEFDIFDKQENIWLSTNARRNILDRTSVPSVRVVSNGIFNHIDEITKLIDKSPFITNNNKSSFTKVCGDCGVELETSLKQTDLTGLMEGVYVKEENENCVVGRYKFVRNSFRNLLDDTEHWLSRPLINNTLIGSRNLFETIGDKND